MLKNPDMAALSDAFILADSHKLVWAAVCLVSGCVLHESLSPSVLTNRPAFTLRNLALAALCLLLVSPSFVYAA